MRKGSKQLSSSTSFSSRRKSISETGKEVKPKKSRWSWKNNKASGDKSKPEKQSSKNTGKKTDLRKVPSRDTGSQHLGMVPNKKDLGSESRRDLSSSSFFGKDIDELLSASWTKPALDKSRLPIPSRTNSTLMMDDPADRAMVDSHTMESRDPVHDIRKASDGFRESTQVQPRKHEAIMTKAIPTKLYNWPSPLPPFQEAIELVATATKDGKGYTRILVSKDPTEVRNTPSEKTNVQVAVSTRKVGRDRKQLVIPRITIFRRKPLNKPTPIPKRKQAKSALPKISPRMKTGNDRSPSLLNAAPPAPSKIGFPFKQASTKKTALPRNQKYVKATGRSFRPPTIFEILPAKDEEALSRSQSKKSLQSEKKSMQTEKKSLHSEKKFPKKDTALRQKHKR
jgi:hypothetical protein